MDFFSDSPEACRGRSCFDHEDGAFLQAVSQAVKPPSPSRGNQTGKCPALNAVGKVTLCLGSGANVSDSNLYWKQKMMKWENILAKPFDGAFDVQYLHNARFWYPPPPQTRTMVSGKLGWLRTALTCPNLAGICHLRQKSHCRLVQRRCQTR